MGGFLAVCYCFGTIGCCCPFCFWNFLWGDKTLMEGQSRDGEAIVFWKFLWGGTRP